MRSTLLFFLLLGSCLNLWAGPGSPLSSDASSAPPGRPARFWKRKPLARIPFQMVKGKIPIVYLDVGKIKNQAFIFDSGSEMTGLTYGEAARLKIPVVPCPRCNAVGTGDSAGESMSFIRSVKMRYGKQFEIKGTSIPTIGLECSRPALGLDIAGIVGFRMLSDKIGAMDFVHNEFVVLKSDELTESVRSSAVVLQFSMNKEAERPVIPATVGVKDLALGPARVEIDTGADSMTIFQRFADDHGLATADGWKPGKICGIGGSAAIRSGTDGWVQIGNQRLVDEAVHIDMATKGMAARNQEDVLLSSAMLKGWVVVFNRKEGHILLIKPEADRTCGVARQCQQQRPIS